MRIFKVVIAIVSWFLIWSISQLFFMENYLSSFIPFSEIQNVNIRFVVFTVWIILVGIIVYAIWYNRTKDVSFLMPEKKKVLYFYCIPVLLALNLIFSGNEQFFGVDSLVYVMGMITTSFYQDILTFGFLQTYLEKITSLKLAAFITVVVFFFGHIPWVLSFFEIVLLLVGFSLFVWLRYRFKHIYLTHVLHASFLLAIMV